MIGKTFVEKIFGAKAGSIVFKKPDIILTHDNTSSIEKIFKKMGGQRLKEPNQLMIVLDHNAPPTNSLLANSYQAIRNFTQANGIKKFHDVGDGICHQLMSNYAKPGMIIVGSDSHTCTAGAFNAFAAGIDRTEAAGLWKKGETWFRVPESFKITLKGKLPKGVYSKDLALFIIGTIGASGADYMSIEFHGTAIDNLSIADRMVISNLASEMGAKNAVFPTDERLKAFLNGSEINPIWADYNAEYAKEQTINLEELAPMVACPHQVENVLSIGEIGKVPVQQALIGTCTNGRLEDLREAARILEDKKIPRGFQLLVTPASKEIYSQAIAEGLIEILLDAGANILSPSCGPCLGTGQGIPADGVNVISTANRNFPGRMGNKNANIYLASPATAAWSALNGFICNKDADNQICNVVKPQKQLGKVEIEVGENRNCNGVWNYSDINSLNTDQMFAGNLTYEIPSSEPEKIVPHLFKGFDPLFAKNVKKGDILICGENFGCGSSREHPSVGLSFVGVKAVIVNSVNRIFYRSAVNQGLPLIVMPEAVKHFKDGDKVDVNFKKGIIKIGSKIFEFNPLPDKLLEIFESGGLVKWMLKN